MVARTLVTLVMGGSNRQKTIKKADIELFAFFFVVLLFKIEKSRLLSTRVAV